MMRVKFWGVRGSIAAAGRDTAQVGGNTSCVEVRYGDTLVILDAGTGLRALGAELAAAAALPAAAASSSSSSNESGAAGAAPVRAHLFLSHFHWDHIQGFPFFAPAYAPGNELVLYAPERCTSGGDVRAAFAAQMRAPHFPVGLDAMRATLRFRAIAAGGEVRLDGVSVRAAAARHPNGCLAYRVSAGGRSLVYATDTEHDAGGALDGDLLELARDADVLVYDAQYTATEYATRRGWGHSTAEEGARLAAAAGVGQLVLFHHDPAHDDWQVARIEAATRARFAATTAAREGLVLTLAPRAGRSAA